MTKKIIAGVLAFTLVMGSAALPSDVLENVAEKISVSASAYENGDEVMSGDFMYGILDDGTAEITDYIGSATDVTVPSVIDNKKVSAIAASTFERNDEIKNVTLPDSITKIKRFTFRECLSLESVTIPNSVTFIDNFAFSSCVNLKSIVVPKSVETLGYCAFFQCRRLESVTLSEGLKAIKMNVFSSCDSLKTINIPASVEEINYASFIMSYNLENINVDENNKAYSSENGILYNKDKSNLIFCPSGSKLSEVNINSNTKSIDDGAFTSCVDIGSVTVPNGVTSIPSRAFDGCLKLSKVNLPDSITNIDYAAFRNCKTMKNITIPKNVTNLGNCAFENCAQLQEIVIPDKVETIGRSAFASCQLLTTVSIPKSVTELGYKAFNNCSEMSSISVDDENKNYSSMYGILFDKEKTNLIYCPKLSPLTTVDVPDSVTEISDSAFDSCKNISKIILPSGLDTIGDDAFYFCLQLKEINIPKSVTEIGDGAFKLDVILKSIVVDKDNKNFTVENGILYNKAKTDLIYCQAGLTDEKVTVPSGVINIKDGAMENVIKAKSIILPDTLKTIGENALNNCYSLESITIPKNVEEIGEGIFLSDRKLTAIYVDENNKNYSSVNGVLYSKDKTELLCFPAGRNIANFSVPDSVTYIGESGFRSCDNIKNISIPSSVERINTYAINNCENLENIIVDSENESYSSVNGILYSQGKSNLFCCPINNKNTEINIPEGTLFISEFAFAGCKNVTKISIPSSLQSICTKKNNGFYFENFIDDCSKLTEIDVDKNNVYFSSTDGILYNKNGTELIYCPQGKESDNLVIPQGVNSIMSYGFSNCKKIKSITLPSSLNNIPSASFILINNLKSIIIPTSVTNIENDAIVCGLELQDIYYMGTENEWNKISIGNSNSIISKDVTIHYGYHEHTYTSKITKAPTCTTEGVRTYTCTICGDTYTEPVKALGHQYEITVVKPTYTSAGYTIHKCKTCGDIYIDSVVPMLERTSISKSSVTKIADKVYTGKAIKPAVTVKYGKTVLKNNTDYTVSYKSNTSVGKATVVISGKGKYKGTKTITFKINPKKQTVKLASYNDAFKASWTKDTQATGYQVMYATKSSFKGSTTVTAGKTATSKTIKGKNKTTYYVKVRTYKTVSGTKYYGSWSTAKSVKTK